MMFGHLSKEMVAFSVPTRIDGWTRQKTGVLLCQLFSSLHEARRHITAWKEDYNQQRPQSSLGNITPSEFAMKMVLEKHAA